MSESTNGNGHVKTLPNGCYEEAAPAPRKQLTPEEMRAATREMRIVNRYRTEKIKHDAIFESFGNYGWDRGQGFGGSDTTEVYMRMRNQAGGSAIPPAQPSDRRAGAKWPVWRTDVELNRLRQASRVMCASNDYAKGLLRNQTNYTIGKGFQYTAGPKKAHKPHLDDPDVDQATNEANRKEKLIKQRGIDKVVDAVQAYIDDFCARNNWNTAAESNDEADDESVGSASSTRERESHWRVDRDGEAIIRLFRNADGTVDVRFVGPEMVWGAPQGRSMQDGWSYGIQHLVTITTDPETGRESRSEDLERIRNYYIRPHQISDNQNKSGKHDAGGEVVPAREIIHIKDPWEDAEVKRGTPVFSYDTFDALMRAANLQRNVSITSAVQAATAEIWKHSIGTKSQIEQLASGNPLSRQVQDGSGAERTETRVYPGMIRRVPAGQEPVPDPATTQVPNYLEAAQGDLRQAAASQSAPEFMVSGDASNGNFASINEAGVPYVRSAEARQEHFKTAFLRLIWRAVAWAVKCGKLPAEAMLLVAITVEGMEIIKNNEGELAQARTQNLTAKVTSPQIECAKLGNDPKQVISDWKEWDKEMAPPEQPGGAPGAPGAAPGAPGGAPGGAAPGAPPQAGPDAEPDAGPSAAPSADPLAGLPEEDLSNWKPGADVQESFDVLEALDSTGTGTTDPDSLGRVYHYVQHKRVKGKEEVAAHRAGAAPKPAAAPIRAKVGDVNVQVVKKDSKSGKAVVKAANGEHLVPIAKLAFEPAPAGEQGGKVASPASPQPAAAATQPANAQQSAPAAAPQPEPGKAVPGAAPDAAQQSASKPSPGSASGASPAAGSDTSPPPTAPVVAGEAVTAPPPAAPQMPMYEPDPLLDTTGSGVADAARVGVPGDSVPPPPPIGRLPRLTETERAVESGFADAYEADPEKMCADYITKKNHVVAAVVKAKHHADAAEHAHAAGFLVKTSTNKDGSADEFEIHGEEPKLSEFLHAYGFHHSLKYEIGDAPNIFATDDCKELNATYNPPKNSGLSPDQVLDNRSQFNTALHNTANAIAKRSFLNFLDGLPPDKKKVLVTSGGVASGKGYALGRIDQVRRVAEQAGAIWDSAGEANGTENDWVLRECEKRGIKPTYLYVHSDPEKTWENPKRGVVERANKKGRMVDARLFTDSYTIGPKNFDAFHKKNADKAQFFIVDNRDEAKDKDGNPTVLDAIPPEALNIDADLLNARCVDYLQKSATVKPAVKRGGLAGYERIWSPAAMAAASGAKPAAAPAPAPKPVAKPAPAPAAKAAPAPAPAPQAATVTESVEPDGWLFGEFASGAGWIETSLA